MHLKDQRLGITTLILPYNIDVIMEAAIIAAFAHDPPFNKKLFKEKADNLKRKIFCRDILSSFHVY